MAQAMSRIAGFSDAGLPNAAENNSRTSYCGNANPIGTRRGFRRAILFADEYSAKESCTATSGDRFLD
jgi:hypothetical protein